MKVLGFLHTSPVHVAPFEALVREVDPAASMVHVPDESLLDRARAEGPEAVADDVRARLLELVDRGATVVCCTCSTIGDVAEKAQVPVPVIRVDRPMARRAIELGPRIGVVAAVQSTLEPTGALLRDEAAQAQVTVEIVPVVVAGAWGRFEAGDHDGYVALIADAARELAEGVDVVVLAQASMADAEALLTDCETPILTSPRLAAESLVQGSARHLGATVSLLPHFAT